MTLDTSIEVVRSRVELTLDLYPYPKQRARVTHKGTFHIHAYQDWLKEAIFQLRQQWKSQPLQSISKLSVQFYGKSARSDLDNLVGAVMDALVKAEVIRNDNLTVINHLETAWERSRDNPKIEIILDLLEHPLN